MKRFICLLLSLVLLLSFSAPAFGDEGENLAEDNTMLNFCVDVKLDDDCYEAVLWAYLNGITKGTDYVYFSPDMAITRGQAITFLWKLADKPVVDYFMMMDDVEPNQYYTKDVRWALAEEITKGTSKTTFSPDQTCTIGEMITFLWRYSGSPVVNYAINTEEITSGAYNMEAIRWALAMNILKDTDFTKICSREEAVSILYPFDSMVSAMAAVASGEKESVFVQVGSGDDGVVVTNNTADSASFHVGATIMWVQAWAHPIQEELDVPVIMTQGKSGAALHGSTSIPADNEFNPVLIKRYHDEPELSIVLLRRGVELGEIALE